MKAPLPWKPHTELPEQRGDTKYPSCLLCRYESEGGYYWLHQGVFAFQPETQVFESDIDPEWNQSARYVQSGNAEPFYWIYEEDLFKGLEAP